MKKGTIVRIEKNGLGEIQSTGFKTYVFHASAIQGADVLYSDESISDRILQEFSAGTKVTFEIIEVLFKQVVIKIAKDTKAL